MDRSLALMPCDHASLAVAMLCDDTASVIIRVARRYADNGRIVSIGSNPFVDLWNMLETRQITRYITCSSNRQPEMHSLTFEAQLIMATCAHVKAALAIV